MIVLPDTLLDNVWKQWCAENKISGWVYTPTYDRVSRRGYISDRFEKWLFVQGATVQRINKKCYIQFSDEEDAVAFRLRYQ
jgi:hypothetical protein